MKSRLVYILSVLFLLFVAIATVSAGDRNAGITVKGEVYEDIITPGRNYTVGEIVDFHVDVIDEFTTTTTINNGLVVDDSISLLNNKDENIQSIYEADCGVFCSLGVFFKWLLGM